MEINELDDEALLAQAREWRLRALRGEREARGHAHELEREVRRRALPHVSSDPVRQLDNRLPQTQQLPALRSWQF